MQRVGLCERASPGGRSWRVALLACSTFLLQAGQAQTLYTFQAQPDGSTPQGGVIGKFGSLYGTTYSGGSTGQGAVFALVPPTSPGGAWSESICHSFTGNPDGTNPAAGLVLGRNGNFYGTTYAGGPLGAGTVFEMKPPLFPGGPCAESVLYAFTGAADGANPLASVAFGKNDIVYGTTGNGGAFGAGTVFRLEPVPAGPWIETVLYSFTNSTDGSNPIAGVAVGSEGALYGTTSSGGPLGNNGLVFKLIPPASAGEPWTETVLHGFTGGGDGGVPGGGVLIGPHGVVYGTTIVGGPVNLADCPVGCGTVFQLTPPSTPGGPWTKTQLYGFIGGSDGANPRGPLLIGSDGSLYGTTEAGGSGCNYGCGTVFKVNLSSLTETVLHRFTGAGGSAHSAASSKRTACCTVRHLPADHRTPALSSD